MWSPADGTREERVDAVYVPLAICPREDRRSFFLTALSDSDDVFQWAIGRPTNLIRVIAM